MMEIVRPSLSIDQAAELRCHPKMAWNTRGAGKMEAAVYPKSLLRVSYRRIRELGNMSGVVPAREIGGCAEARRARVIKDVGYDPI